jgi:hypothetical protein
MEKKIVREHILLFITENKITKSYVTPMTMDEMKHIIVSILKKYDNDFSYRQARPLTSMNNWLQLNNFNNFKSNKWLKAVIDNTFKYNNGIWYRINKNLSIDELADLSMNYWDNKFKHI